MKFDINITTASLILTLFFASCYDSAGGSSGSGSASSSVPGPEITDLTMPNLASQIARIRDLVASGKKIKMVLGAGNMDSDLARFGDGWVAVTDEISQIDPKGTPFLHFDFNDVTTWKLLAQSENLANHFEQIIFDISVVKFTKFNILHLRSIQQLLQPGKTLIMDLKSGSSSIYIWNGLYYQDINGGAGYPGGSFLDFKASLTSLEKDEASIVDLILLRNFTFFKGPKDNTTETPFVDKIKHLNELLLKKSGFSSVEWRDDENYPVPTHPILPQKTLFLVAIK